MKLYHGAEPFALSIEQNISTSIRRLPSRRHDVLPIRYRKDIGYPVENEVAIL